MVKKIKLFDNHVLENLFAKTYYNLGKFSVMLMIPSDRKTWWGIYDYLNRYHKDLKEEGWRLPTPPELFYINDVYNLKILKMEKGEYWTSEPWPKDAENPSYYLTYTFTSPQFTLRKYLPVKSTGTMSVKLPVLLVKDI